MSKSIALSLLAQGSTGDELLSILDALAAEAVSDTEESTIEFWLLTTVRHLVDTGCRLCYTRDISRGQCFAGGCWWRCGRVMPFQKPLTTLTYRGDKSTSNYHIHKNFPEGKSGSIYITQEKICPIKFSWKRFIIYTQRINVCFTLWGKKSLL